MTEMTPKEEFREFWQQLLAYLGRHGKVLFGRFEAVKDVFAGVLYHKRGMYAQPLLHSAMMAMIFLGITFGPSLVQSSFATDEDGSALTGEVLGATLDSSGIVTLVSDKPPSEVRDYSIKDGDTLSGVAAKFDVSVDTIKWANESVDWKKIKPGTVVKIPPVTGLVYKVKPGDTIYSIAKKFETSEQAIVDWPFNTFSDDETFALVAGQTLVVPDGVMPDAVSSTTATRFTNILTPDAGAVTATGSFVWPAYGRITQGYRWYHPAVDIANHDGGPILAADSGTIVAIGWDSSGYGNRIIIDHGNGYKTLYAHMSAFSVQMGQHVARGAVIGQMGSTGRSTGTHLHFEIHAPGGKVDPLGYLK